MNNFFRWLFFATSLSVVSPSFADEGMWTFDNPPMKKLEEHYGFKPSAEWIEHVQMASLRVGGASGSFVSSNGLILTNHHVARGQLQKVSTAKKDFIKDGFYAHTIAEEIKCPDLEVNDLISMVEVTDQIQKAIDKLPPNSTNDEKNKARKAEIAKIEKESTDKTGHRSDVVELYRGGEYWLYRYKKYTDIRLVMAPEHQAAFFGGDPDNFTYPRYNLDFAFLRAYENNKPVHPKHYLKWNTDNLKEGDLVFVTGHPGSTSRNLTLSQLQTKRDLSLPLGLQQLKTRRDALLKYSSKGEEETRRAKSFIFGVENSIKAMTGYYDGLNDNKLMSRLEIQEKDLQAKVSKNGELSKLTGTSWKNIEKSQELYRARAQDFFYRNLPSSSTLVSLAGLIYRYSTEVAKPNSDRLEEFRDSSLDSLKLFLFSPAPIYTDMEEVLFATDLHWALKNLGPDDSFVKKILDGKTPEALAHSLLSGTKLSDPTFRRKLIDGGKPSVDSANDPLIVWFSKFDSELRERRKWYDDKIQSVNALEGRKIAKARFALEGKNIYPDATGTLRFSYGKVAGYDQGTTHVPYKTTFMGYFERSESFDGKTPFEMPLKISKARNKFNLSTPLNFVTTNDIIGGNSGSPIIDRNGNLVGLVFDGNIQSLVGEFAFSGNEQGRTVGVHAKGIITSIQKIYNMPNLAKELLGH